MSVDVTSERRQESVIMVGVALLLAGGFLAWRYRYFDSVWLGVIIVLLGIGVVLTSELWNRHTLIIGLPSGDVRPYTHYSESRVCRIAEAIVDAMLRRDAAR